MLLFFLVSPGILSCLPIAHKPNVLTNTTDVSIGTVVQFGCISGFTINGTTITICQSNGTWSSSVPTCVMTEAQCPEIPLLKHMIASSSNRSVGAEVTLACEKGYKIDGEATIYCTENSTWSDSFPECTADSTPPPPQGQSSDHGGQLFLNLSVYW